MHEPTGLPRVDLNSIKERLKLVLKDNIAQYWEILRKFVQAKLSKKEFDYYAKSLLGDEHVPLHNMFIRAILSNARCGFPPVISHQATRPPKKKPAVHIKEPIPSPSLPTTVNNTPQQPSSALPTSKKAPGKLNKKSNNSASTQKAGGAGTTKTGGTKPKTTTGPKRTAVKEVPLGAEHNVLRQRMQRIATEAGLAGLTHDSIRVMMTAVEQYVKRVVQASPPAYRPHPPLPSNTAPPVHHFPMSTSFSTQKPSLLPPTTLSSSQSISLSSSSSSVPQPQQQQQQQVATPPTTGTTITISSPTPTTTKFNTITLQDLHKTTSLHHSLFGDDFLLNQERVSIALM